MAATHDNDDGDDDLLDDLLDDLEAEVGGDDAALDDALDDLDMDMMLDDALEEDAEGKAAGASSSSSSGGGGGGGDGAAGSSAKGGGGGGGADEDDDDDDIDALMPSLEASISSSEYAEAMGAFPAEERARWRKIIEADVEAQVRFCSGFAMYRNQNIRACLPRARRVGACWLSNGVLLTC